MRNKKITSLILSLLFLGVVGAYYIQPFLTAPKEIQFQFQTKEGDQEELKGMHLINTSWSEGDSEKDISLEKTVRGGSRFFGSAYTNRTVRIKKWQSQYRSFMRNKVDFEGNFTEDEEGLFYIEDGYEKKWEKDDENHFLLPIERLDKETKEVTKKDLKISAPADLDYVSSQIFEKAGPFLAIYLIIGNYQTQERITYFYNWETGETIDELKQKTTSENANYGSSFNLEVLDEQDPRFLLKETKYYYHFEDPMEEVTTVEDWNQIYYPATKELQEIQLPEEFSKDTAQYLVEDGKVTLVTRQEDAIHVAVYDAENNKMLQEKSVPIDTDTFAEELYVQLNIHDGKLFITENYAETPEDEIGILVLEEDRLEKRFEGTLQVAEASKSELVDEPLYFDDIYFD